MKKKSFLLFPSSIAASQTLAVTGNFLLAGSATATTATNAIVTGADGSLTVGGTSFQVAQTTPTAGTANKSLDMGGLGTLMANLGATGIFRLGSSVGTGTSGAQVTTKLAATGTITTDVLGIGDRASRGGTQARNRRQYHQCQYNLRRTQRERRAWQCQSFI